MSTDVPTAADEVVYPDSDGQPMADNTLQWDWMVKVVGELREMFAGQEVLVAGDLLWYPVKGDAKTRTAPDARVVFEVLSPNGTREHVQDRLERYERAGVEEYYLIDLRRNRIVGWVRGGGHLQMVYPMDGFVSPLLGLRFEGDRALRIFAPEGRELGTPRHLGQESAEQLTVPFVVPVPSSRPPASGC